MRRGRRWLALLALVLLFLPAPRPAGGYSVFTHEELIDLTWSDSIRPLLLKRFPNLTPGSTARSPRLRLRRLRDPGPRLLSLRQAALLRPAALRAHRRLHPRALPRIQGTPNDVAFAIGALSHYFGDTIGHPEAVNLAVARSSPKLAASIGPNVNYAEGPHQHVRTEFAFDINDIAKHRLAPESYLNHIGFAVPDAAALTRLLRHLRPRPCQAPRRTTVPHSTGYRYAVRTFCPASPTRRPCSIASTCRPTSPVPRSTSFNQQIAALCRRRTGPISRHAGFGTHLLAGFIFILPKVGPLSDLSCADPAPPPSRTTSTR